MTEYALTGASGYIGSIIQSELGPDNVVSLVRKPRGPRDIAWSFTSSMDLTPALMQRSVRVLIHCAWDMQASSAAEVESVCVRGSKRLFEAAERAGVHRIIFISTISAFEGCRSVYGQKKLAVEEQVGARSGVILRLGLVFGPHAGGAFGNLYRQVTGKSVVPVINRGSEPQYLLSERTLRELVRRAARGDFDGASGQPITVAHPSPWPFRAMVQRIAALRGRTVRIVPVPWPLLYGGARFAESLGIGLPFRSDSIVSVVRANPSPDFTAMRTWGIDPIPFPEGL